MISQVFPSYKCLYILSIMTETEYLTVEEVSKLLKVHWQTTLNYIRSGKLRAVRLGKGYRIGRESLDKFINERHTRRTK